jgi:hypothetical protein
MMEILCRTFCRKDSRARCQSLRVWVVIVMEMIAWWFFSCCFRWLRCCQRWKHTSQSREDFIKRTAPSVSFASWFSQTWLLFGIFFLDFLMSRNDYDLQSVWGIKHERHEREKWLKSCVSDPRASCCLIMIRKGLRFWFSSTKTSLCRQRWWWRLKLQQTV